MANNNGNGSKQATSREEPAKTAARASAGKKSQDKKKENIFRRLVNYLKGVRQEFGKVVWPTREELATNTVVVFACVIFFALAFWLVDTGFLAALKGILGITLS